MVTRRPSPASYLRVAAALLRVIIVDDDSAVLRSFKRALKLRRATWDVMTLTSSREALDALAEGSYDVLITDYEMPGIDGVQLLSQVRTQFPNVRRIVLSGRPAETANDLPPGIVQSWVCKGLGVDELIEAIETLLSKSPDQTSQLGAC
jgi:DNA-binding NtrC family response regulator